MPGDLPTTTDHKGPLKPEGAQAVPALICAFPTPRAIALLASSVTVGRSWLAQHGVTDTEISSEHLLLAARGGRIEIADAGSRNGTWVNGARLSPKDSTPLEEGAVVRIGRTVFVYRSQLRGEYEPSPPLGQLVGAFGLRGVASSLSSFSQHPPNNVLIEGETGVGKELVAQAAATYLGRSKPFAAVNVASIASGVFESQLFGHVAGAFSDARSATPGVLTAHSGGSVFLDEIGELGLDAQVKLLRVLENREILPVGASRPVTVDVLIIAATNRDLDELVQQDRFRRDLLARLSKARIHVPALRDRAEDLFGLASALSKRDGFSFEPEQVEVEAVERLMLHDWPSNVRELDALLAAARRSDPKPGLRLWTVNEILGEAATPRGTLTSELVEAAIAKANGNVSAAADSLGVSRGKLLRFRKRSEN
jgi:MoxR-like ATPase